MTALAAIAYHWRPLRVLLRALRAPMPVADLMDRRPRYYWERRGYFNGDRNPRATRITWSPVTMQQYLDWQKADGVPA